MFPIQNNLLRVCLSLRTPLEAVLRLHPDPLNCPVLVRPPGTSNIHTSIYLGSAARESTIFMRPSDDRDKVL